MRDQNGVPRVVVTADKTLTDRGAHWLSQQIQAWLADGGKLPLVIADEHVHVAAEQPDGSWLRLCHDHALTDVGVTP